MRVAGADVFLDDGDKRVVVIGSERMETGIHLVADGKRIRPFKAQLLLQVPGNQGSPFHDRLALVQGHTVDGENIVRRHLGDPFLLFDVQTEAALTGASAAPDRHIERVLAHKQLVEDDFAFLPRPVRNLPGKR